MTNPLLIISKDERTTGGSLSVRHLAVVARVLNGYGYVLLPSDTAYSLAALAVDPELQKRLNKILNRPKWPISLSFPSARVVREWTLPSMVVDHLMEQFCPGPITIVCEARPHLPTRFFDATIASGNGTIGVRIPDSIVERDVAGSTSYPITTAAVRERGDGPAVTDFARAVEIVSAGMASLRDATWCAIEGGSMYDKHSTVVRVTRSGWLERIRVGFIPYDEIERSIAALPASAFDSRE